MPHADTKHWSSITGIDHGSAWCSSGFNYDDLTQYPPGLVTPSLQPSNRGRSRDDRNTRVQRAMMGEFALSRLPSVAPWQLDFRQRSTKSEMAPFEAGSRSSSVTTSGSGSAGVWSRPGTPTPMTEWVVEQKENNELRGSTKEFAPSGGKTGLRGEATSFSTGSEVHGMALPKKKKAATISGRAEEGKAAWEKYASWKRDLYWEAHAVQQYFLWRRLGWQIQGVGTY